MSKGRGLSNRLLKSAHLRRYAYSAGIRTLPSFLNFAAYLYVRPLFGTSGALHPDVFEQPEYLEGGIRRVLRVGVG